MFYSSQAFAGFYVNYTFNDYECITTESAQTVTGLLEQEDTGYSALIRDERKRCKPEEVVDLEKITVPV